jgi:SAM-dependent methyltransferase
MTYDNSETIRQAVRARYGTIAQAGSTCCGSTPASCCGTDNATAPDATALSLGYTSADVAAVPAGANLGLGCGNPQALAALRLGETVLDLGSGGGFDCFLAARAVGQQGQVIGVDMTPEMVSKARENAAKVGLRNVEFRLGEIEHLPVADQSVDVILSNCVINLSPDKAQVFCDAFRVLKPGGRLAITDMVATAALPEAVRHDFTLYTGCVAGAAVLDDLERMLAATGFTAVRIQPRDASRPLIREWVPGSKAEDFVVSATIEATKP